MVTVSFAADALGLRNTSSLMQKGSKYFKYYRPAGECGTVNAMFDLAGYKKEADIRDELVAKTTLFTEYLRYEEGIPYSKMQAKTNVHAANLRKTDYGYESALRICRAYKDTPEWGRFHEYYGWRKK